MQESEAWENLSSTEYDSELSRLFNVIKAAPTGLVPVNAVIALTSQALRRNQAAFIESRFCCAECLLVFASATADAMALLRLRMLFLLAWLHLGAAAARGPDAISATPDLPPGVTLPDGADPILIQDPILRAQAQEAVKQHRAAAACWNAKQRALGYLYQLAEEVKMISASTSITERPLQELLMAMALASGVPSALQQSLIDRMHSGG
ncbi:hypothetical protein [Sphaerothrix gracilis]|uniref:hypothetical protein n=1 Tax=Sphaerothrix gracilis TaxID=3151835 RepID=UPI0031FE1D86